MQRVTRWAAIVSQLLLLMTVAAACTHRPSTLVRPFRTPVTTEVVQTASVARGRVIGIVVDVRTGEPVRLAQVLARGTHIFAITDSLGRFELEGLASPHQPLIFISPEFSRRVLEVDFGAPYGYLARVALYPIVSANAVVAFRPPPSAAETKGVTARPDGFKKRGPCSPYVLRFLNEFLAGEGLHRSIPLEEDCRVVAITGMAGQHPSLGVSYFNFKKAFWITSGSDTLRAFVSAGGAIGELQVLTPGFVTADSVRVGISGRELTSRWEERPGEGLASIRDDSMLRVCKPQSCNFCAVFGDTFALPSGRDEVVSRAPLPEHLRVKRLTITGCPL